MTLLLLSLAVAGGGVRASRGEVRASETTGLTCPVATRLLMGSADPHGLGLEERQAPMRRRPTFNSLAHVGADDDELLQRPFVEFNVAPETSRRELPEDPVAGAPVFTRLDEIVPRATLARVGVWRRQLRRSLQFASSGNFSMAKRLCPPDLW